jgi:hypothetical protein
MKKVLILCVLSIFLSNCSTEEIATPVTSKSESVLPTSDKNNDIFAKPIKSTTEVTLSIATRGFSSSVSIKNGMMTKNSTGIVPPTTIQISTAKLTIYNQKFAALNLVKIPTYNAPTCLRCADQDLGQTLQIKHDGVTYTSKTYDSTNPPAALRDFISCINGLN